MLHPVLAATLLLTAPLALRAQEPVQEIENRPGVALPEAEAERVQSILDAAQERALVAHVENFLRELAAKGAPPARIAEGVQHRFDELCAAQDALAAVRGTVPSSDEVLAGAEVMRRGVNGNGIAELAASAPSGRSLAVPLLVTAELLDRGLPSDDAIALVSERLLARVADAELRSPSPPGAAVAELARANAPGTATSAAARNSSGRPTAPGRSPRSRSGRSEK